MPFEYTIVAYDPNRDQLSFSLENAPAGMTIDTRGVVKWAPGEGENNKTFDAKVIVDDGRGGKVSHPFSLKVGRDNFFFVSPNGNDANDGSINAPFGSIEFGMEKTGDNGGGTLLIRGGTYNIAWNWETNGVKSPLTGKRFTAENPAEIRSYPNEKVILDCQNNGHGLWAFQTSYVLFDDIEVRNASAGEKGGAIAHGDHVVFVEIIVRDSDWSAKSNCTGFLMQGEEAVAFRCEAHDNYERNGIGVSTNNSNYLVYNDNPEPFKMFIIDSLSSGTTGGGYKIKHAGQSTLTIHGVYDEGSSSGFLGADEGSSVRYSTFVENGNGIRVGITDPNEFTKKNMEISNNTIIDPSGAALAFQTSYMTDGNVNFSRNVIRMKVDPSQTNDNSPNLYRIHAYDDTSDSKIHTFEQNCIGSPTPENAFRLGGTYLSWEEWRNLGHEQNSVFADPDFVQESYALSPESPCLEIGVEVGSQTCR